MCRKKEFHLLLNIIYLCVFLFSSSF